MPPVCLVSSRPPPNYAPWHQTDHVPSTTRSWDRCTKGSRTCIHHGSTNQVLWIFYGKELLGVLQIREPLITAASDPEELMKVLVKDFKWWNVILVDPRTTLFVQDSQFTPLGIADKDNPHKNHDKSLTLHSAHPSICMQSTIEQTRWMNLRSCSHVRSSACLSGPGTSVFPSHGRNY